MPPRRCGRRTAAARGSSRRGYKDRPAFHQPGGGGDADICKADLACPHPALEVPQPAAPAADLVGRVPDSVVHGLGKAAHQAGPQQKACGRQQPRRACREPPRRELGQKVHLDLGKNGRVPVRNIPGLAYGQHEQGQRGEAVGPQKAQCRPVPLRAGRCRVGFTRGISWSATASASALGRQTERVCFCTAPTG